MSGAPRRAGRLARTRFARLVTRVPPERLTGVRDRISAGGVAGTGLALPVRWYERGEVTIAGGAGVGLRMAARDIPLWHAHAHSLVRGSLEVELQEALRRTAGPGDTVWDVGGNAGFFALIAARLVGRDGRVCSFEPVPELADGIRRGAELNGTAQLEVIEAALGAETGSATLLVPGDPIWARLESVGRHPDTRRELEVELWRGDDWLARDGGAPPRVVKIDVEGAELDVLEGMRGLLSEHRPVVLCELHAKHAGFIELMEELSYRCTSLEAPGPLIDAPPNVRAIAAPGELLA